MDYEKFKLKSFNHWDLYLHKNQFPYIGRCYTWSKRENADKVTDMTKEESLELFEIIIPLWDKAIKESFGEHRPNVSCFGNTAPHLHWHLIPRHTKDISFEGIRFIDSNPTGNYAPYPNKQLKEAILQKIMTLIKKNL